MKKITYLVLIIALFSVFSACSNNNKADETTTSTTASTTVSTTEKITATETTTETTTEITTDKTTTKATTTPMPTTKSKEAIPISVNEALDRLTEFYGSAYNVNASVKEGKYQYFRVTDKKDNLYARVKVNLKTSYAEETIEHSGEVNKFNLLV